MGFSSCDVVPLPQARTNARRHRLQPASFVSYEMPVPSITKLLELQAIYQHTQSLKGKHAAIRRANAALLPAMLERVFGSMTHGANYGQ